MAITNTPCSFSLAAIVLGSTPSAISRMTILVSTGKMVRTKSFFPERRRDLPGVQMIDGQALHIILQRINPRRGHKPRLTHAAPKNLPHASGLPDKGGLSQQDTADRASQPLIQTNRYAIEGLAPAARIVLFGDQRIKQPGPVQMKPQRAPGLARMFVADLPDFFYFLQPITASPSPVTGILQTDQRGPGLVHIIGIDGGGHLFGGDPAPIPIQGPHLRAGIERDPSSLIDVYMGAFLTYDLIPRSCMTLYSDLVGHRSAWAIQGGLHPK